MYILQQWAFLISSFGNVLDLKKYIYIEHFIKIRFHFIMSYFMINKKTFVIILSNFNLHHCSNNEKKHESKLGKNEPIVKFSDWIKLFIHSFIIVIYCICFFITIYTIV